MYSSVEIPRRSLDFPGDCAACPEDLDSHPPILIMTHPVIRSKHVRLRRSSAPVNGRRVACISRRLSHTRARARVRVTNTRKSVLAHGDSRMRPACSAAP